jgi:hypothetical protein
MGSETSKLRRGSSRSSLRRMDAGHLPCTYDGPAFCLTVALFRVQVVIPSSARLQLSSVTTTASVPCSSTSAAAAADGGDGVCWLCQVVRGVEAARGNVII